jgi:C-terminal processing protease CtpA/Prc
MVGRVQMLPQHVGYLEVKNFATDNVAEFERAIELLKDAKALILDLRQCPGGGPIGVRYLSTYLFSKPTHLVSTYTRGMDAPAERWTLESVPGPRLVDVPVYILISRRTFSAGESFTFGLKITGRAVIVGEKTAGGGHFGNIVPLPHGLQMFLPTGRTYDPRTGKGWEADGIHPDIETPSADALEAAIKHYRG